MASLLGIGVSGLRTSQTALQITGNNISNAGVEGYSRQRTEIVTAPEQLGGGGYIGGGAKVEDISRVVDEYLSTQIQLDTASFNQVATYGDNAEQLTSLLAGEFSSLGPSLASMFSAIEVSIEDPTSMPSRQLVLSEAEGFVERAHTIYNRLDQQANSINEQISSITTELSSLSKAVAELNDSIVRELGIGQGSAPNGLMDERDEVIRQIAELVSVRTTTESSGAINVFIGNGQPLVVGNAASAVTAVPGTANTGAFDVQLLGANGQPVTITNSISGGKLGGLLDFRAQALEPAFNAMGQIMLSVADTLNQTNQQGLDLEGNYGSSIFMDINTAAFRGERAFANRANTGNAGLEVAIDDVSLLTRDNYTLTVNDATTGAASLINRTTGEVINGNFTSVDHDNNAATANVDLFVPTVVAATPTDSSASDGLAIFFQTGALATGDSFTLQPSRSAANNIQMQMFRPQELAYASPISTESSLNNSGGAEISAGTIIQAFDRYGNPSPAFSGAAGTLTPEIDIVFTAANSYEVRDTAGVVLFTSTFTQGQSNQVFGNDPADPNYTGYQVALSGTPSAGDTFTVRFNTDGVSDNRNGLDLGASRVDGVMEGNTLNYEDAYGRLVERLGADTAQNRVLKDSNSALLASSTANRASVSGVNLDEEAANLIKFEQAYNANAQIITVARQIFDTLLNAFR